MKKLILLTGILFLTACTSNTPITTQEPTIHQVPDFVVLEDANEIPLGRGFKVKGNTWIAPDHLFVAGDKALYWKGQRLEILARDFTQDILAFELSLPQKKQVFLVDTPPAVNQPVYWFEQFIKSGTVSGIGVDFQAQNQTKENLIEINGSIPMGLSGGVVFDPEGKVWGMIIGADKTDGVFYTVRADVIAMFVEEVVD